jgi:hypothetical protein
MLTYKPLNEKIELITPLECKEYPGYYYYPYFDDIIINKNGSIIKLSTNIKL